MNNILPLVSVIVPSYNHEKYVQETIESIVNQTYENIELIVIDDGSKDASPKIIEKLSKKYNFKFIHRLNKGLSATLNEGIGLSSGKYICVCASDDIYKLNKIEKQVQFMENNPHYGLCFGKIINFNDLGNETKNNPKHAKSGWVFKDIIYQYFTMPAVTCMIRKNVFETIGYYDENLFVEDWDMYLRITDKYQVGYLNEYLAYYRKHDTNITHQKTKIFDAQQKTLNKWKESEYYKEAKIMYELKFFIYDASGNKWKALNYFLTHLQYFYYRRFIRGTINLVFLNWIKKDRIMSIKKVQKS